MKLIRQKTFKDCGVACIAMLISHYFKFNIDIEQIKYQLDLDDEQLSFFEISNIAQFFKLSSEAFEVNIDFDELNNKTPFIAQVINQEGITHFVVVEKIMNSYVHFLDPSMAHKQKLALQSFINIFQNYVMIFKPDKKCFRTEFNLHWPHVKSIFNWDSIAYLWIMLINAVLMIFETKMIKVFSNTLSQEFQSIAFYSLFFIIFLIGFLCTKSCSILLNKAYEKNIQKALTFFLDYTSRTKQKNLQNFYSQIIWIYKFEQFRIMNFLSSIVTEIIVFIYIFIIANKIFFVMLAYDVLLLLIIWFKNNSFPKISTNDVDSKWIQYFSNLNNLKDSGNEINAQNELLKQDYKQSMVNDFELFIDLLIKVSTLIIYYFSWGLIKNAEIDFNSFFVILILKSFNRSFIFNLNFIVTNWRTYLSYKIKSTQILFSHSNSRSIKIDSIEKISILDNIKHTRFHINKKNYKNNFPFPLRIINKTFQAREWEVFINDTNIKLIDDAHLRLKIFYVNANKIIFGTIYQNIILFKNKSSINIFSQKIVNNLLSNYRIKLHKLIEPETICQLEKEIIALLSIFFNNAQLIILDMHFEIIAYKDVKSVIKLFHQLFNDKFLILN